MKRRIIKVFSLAIAFVAFLNISKHYLLDNDAEIGALGHARAAESDGIIFGQVHYDPGTNIPSQAKVFVQLIDQTPNSGAPKIISEARIPAGSSGKTEFKLPIAIKQLDKTHQYVLKAQILIGDSLIYVSETPTAIDLKQTGYIMRLASIGHHQSPTMQQKGITGSQWVAREINNIAIPKDANINLIINNTTKSPLLGIDNGAALTNHYLVNGSGGCNRFFSSALVNENDNSLTFDPLGMAFISCSQPLADQEKRFVTMMSQVRRYQIDKNNMLNFKDSYDHIIARFIAHDSI